MWLHKPGNQRPWIVILRVKQSRLMAEQRREEQVRECKWIFHIRAKLGKLCDFWNYNYLHAWAKRSEEGEALATSPRIGHDGSCGIPFSSSIVSMPRRPHRI